MAGSRDPGIKSELNMTSESNGTSVAAFIAKVWKIVNKKDYEHLISWSDQSGKTFTVHDYSAFAKEVLPHYFKHSNFASFVRQLNLYGFRKVAKPEQGVLAGGRHDYDSVEFWHTNFRRDHPELLPLVQRRSVASRTGNEEKHPNMSRVLSDLHQLKGHHEGVAGMLDNLRRENVLLKQEMAQLKRKHSHQRKIINKIIHFLMTMVYKGQLPNRMGRQLMLADRETTVSDLPVLPQSKRPRLDADSKELGSQAYKVQSPQSTVSSNTLLTPSVSYVSTTLASGSPEVNPMPASLPPSDALDILAADDSSDNNDEELLSNLAFEQLPESSLLPPSSIVQSTSPGASQNMSPGLSLPSTTSSVMPSIEPSLVPYQEPGSNVDHVSTHLDQHQHVIDSLPDLLSGQLSLDPLLLSAFLYDSQNQPLPDYDQVDTARLLESLADPDSEVPHESTIRRNSLVPLSHAPAITGLFGYDEQ